jgi:uncharacterized membrane protein
MFTERFRKNFLTTSETESVLKTIREVEKSTSGEIRLFIESKCMYMNPFDRAKEIFIQLQMQKTIDRNAVLLYIAHKDHDFAICSDKALHEKVEASFWSKQSKTLAKEFHAGKYTEAIVTCIKTIGNELIKHFPWEGEQKNELPDDIVFGK